MYARYEDSENLDEFVVGIYKSKSMAEDDKHKLENNQMPFNSNSLEKLDTDCTSYYGYRIEEFPLISVIHACYKKYVSINQTQGGSNMSEHTVTHPNMVRNAREAKRPVRIYSYDYEALRRVALMYEEYADPNIVYDCVDCRHILRLKMPPYVRNQMAKDLKLIDRPASYYHTGKEYFLRTD